MAKQFEFLTKYIDIFEDVYDVKIWDISTEFEKDIMKFIDEYTDIDLKRYYDILDKKGYRLDKINPTEIDISNADSELILAIIVFAYRQSCSSDSSIVKNYNKDILIKWLRKLKELDK